jgi:uncharacterized protein YkwD
MPKLLRWIAPLTALMALAIAAPAQASSSSCADADALPVELTVDQYNASLLCLINGERDDYGLGALKANRKLARAALGHSSSMTSRRYVAHTEPNGATFYTRIIRTGYKRGAARWLLGENIGTGTKYLGTPGAMVIGWMNSPEHRRNILEPTFRDIGIGTIRGAPTLLAPSEGMTITTDFGVKTYG